MTRPFVDYLIARDGPPDPSGLIYDYLIAGNGIWLAAENAALAVRVPVGEARVRGLPPLAGGCILKRGPLPQTIWRTCVGIARAFAARRREVLILVILRAGGYELVVPEQVQTPSRVAYARPRLATGDAIVLELHSHHVMRAFFSATDTADEQALAVYGVVGRLDRPVAEVLLRAGAYGHMLSVPWSCVFAGDAGAFRDLGAPDTDPGGGDELESHPLDGGACRRVTAALHHSRRQGGPCCGAGVPDAPGAVAPIERAFWRIMPVFSPTVRE